MGAKTQNAKIANRAEIHTVTILFKITNRAESYYKTPHSSYSAPSIQASVKHVGSIGGCRKAIKLCCSLIWLLFQVTAQPNNEMFSHVAEYVHSLETIVKRLVVAYHEEHKQNDALRRKVTHTRHPYKKRTVETESQKENEIDFSMEIIYSKIKQEPIKASYDAFMEAFKVKVQPTTNL